MLRQSSEQFALAVRNPGADTDHERTPPKAWSFVFNASTEDASTPREHTLDSTSHAPVILSVSTSNGIEKQRSDETRPPRNLQ